MTILLILLIATSCNGPYCTIIENQAYLRWPFLKTKVERLFKVRDVLSPISTALIITYHNLFFPKDKRTFKVCDERGPGSGKPDPKA